MARGHKTIDVHLDVAPARGEAMSTDAGGCQINRGLFRPILEDSGYALCDVIDRDPANRALTLEMRPSLACDFDAHDLGVHLTRLLETESAFSQLFGLVASSIRITSATTLHLSLDTDTRLFEAALKRDRFAPRHDRHGKPAYTGAYLPVSRRVLEASTGVQVRFRVIASAEHAVSLFEREEIALSCPTAFDLAAQHSVHPLFRACETSVYAMVLFNPERTGVLSDSAWRTSICRTVAAEPFPWGGIKWFESYPPLRHGHRPGDAVGDRTSITFGRYWPNRMLAQRLSAALGEHGVKTVALRAMSLARLGAALADLDFDVLLWIIVSLVPGEEGVLLWMAEMAIHLAADEDKATVVRLFRVHQETRTDETRNDLREALLQLLPFMPLCGFRSGYLARPWVPVRPIVDGTVYPIETLAGINP